MSENPEFVEVNRPPVNGSIPGVRTIISIRNLSRFALSIAVLFATLAWTAAPARALDPALERLLSLIPDQPETRAKLWYGAPGALQDALKLTVASAEDVAKLDPKTQAVYLRAFGGQLYTSPFLGLDNADQKKLYGFDAYQVARELTAGIDPAWLGVVEGGLDAGNIDRALTATGYTGAAANGGKRYTAKAAGLFANIWASGTLAYLTPSAALLDAALALKGGQSKPLAANPLYLAAARALDTGKADLLSAVLFDYTTFTGKLLPNVTGTLPRWSVAGIGYERTSATIFHQWRVTLIYATKADADTAAGLLPSLFKGYTSKVNQDKVYANWNTTVERLDVNGQVFAVTLIAQPTSNTGTEQALVPLFEARDLGFLATR